MVVRNQLERILRAVAAVAQRSGYAQMTVDEITAEAGVSRRTFYDHFRNKEEAFLAGYDAAVEILMSGVRSAYSSQDTWVESIRAGLRTFLDFFADHPDFAHMCVVEVLAAGPPAIERRNAAMKEFAASFIEPGREEVPKGTLVPPLASESVVGGIYELLHARISEGRVEELPELMPELTYSILLPFLGPAVATKEYKRARRARKRR